MLELDYEKLKLKCGLEIHQQLDTKKLFCNCVSLLRKDEPDFLVERKLHAVAGETGEIDIAVRHEIEKGNEFVYQGYDTTCLVELDEEPPHEINKEALRIALHVALLLNCKIIPLTQIMRKMVVDGSNTSGFQRTVLIARDGYVETSFGRVGIESICLEEDAARKVGKEKDKIIFRLDRLGIPLVEIATAPDIKSPEQAKEAALHIGNILRSCNVKRGIGTIRQDVNLSIRNENRVELKGVQDMKIFLKIVENEILRQKGLSDSGKPVKPEVRNALANGETEFLRPMPGASRMYPETDLMLLKISRDFINDAKKSLPKLRSEVEKDLMKKGLSQDDIKLLFKRNKLEEFKNLVDVFHKPSLVVKIVVLYPKEISKKSGKSLEDVEDILEDYYGDILSALEKGKISESDVKSVMRKIVEGEKFDEIVKKEKIDVGEIEEKILKMIKEKPGLSANAYMGLVMKEFKGKINGKEVREIIERLGG